MKKIFIAGHRGLVGSALHRLFSKQADYEVIVRTRSEVDLEQESSVRSFFEKEKPDQVVLAAAKVGGIKANWDYPVDFLLLNLKIQNNIIENAHRSGVKKLLFLGSSCIYPKLAPQPLKEEYLLSGYLEPTNEAYAIAKIAGIKLCQAFRRQHDAHFIAAMPTNMYGPYDNFNLESSHVLPALIRKFHEAKRDKKSEVILWGSGSPKREFLHSDDLAEACKMLLETYDDAEIVNVGTGEDLTIRALAEIIQKVVDFEGKLVWDTSKPDGTPRKLMDVSKINALGWKARIPLTEGIRSAYDWYRQQPGI